MAGSKQYKTHVWDAFSQTPAKPELGENPVTRVVNMELTPEKTIRTRRGFKTGPTGITVTPDSHITSNLVGIKSGSSLVVNSNKAIYRLSGNTFSSVGLSGLHYKSIDKGEPGSFSVYGGEVYFCQNSVGGGAMFSYDGVNVRNVGVPGMGGKYFGVNPHVKAAQDFSIDNYCGYFCQCLTETLEIDYRLPGGLDKFCCGESGAEGDWDGNCGWGETDTSCIEGAPYCDLPNPCAAHCESGPDTGLFNQYQCLPQEGSLGGIFCWHVPSSSTHNSRGEKILNFSFKVGYYDAKRGIFGKACSPKSIIRFGPNRSSYALYQYMVEIAPPGMTGAGDLGLAIWCSPPTEVLTMQTPSANFGTQMLYDEVHAMSDHLSDMMFLEDIVLEGATGQVGMSCPSGKICLYKDQSSLADSGQYSEQYDRPVPSETMAILPGGTALYFFPRHVSGANDSSYQAFGDNPYSFSPAGVRPGVEYSVGHPEQIGRSTHNQKDTFSPLPSMRGKPMHTFNDSGSTILLTRQTIYQLGFSGAPQVQELGGPGVLTHQSVHPTSNGVLWVADEGPVWLKGGKAVEILRELRFDGWMDELTKSQKKDVRIGLIEDSKKLLMTFPIPGETDRYRVLMHDIGDDFTSEWWIGSGQQTSPDDQLTNPGSSQQSNYMISHRADGGYAFYMWLDNTCMEYDPRISSYNNSDESGDTTSLVEMWVNENAHLDKVIGNVQLDLGYRSGDFTVRVSTFDNPNDIVGVSYKTLDERTAIVETSDGQRVSVSKFMGMRGRYFRIRIEASGQEISLNRVTIDLAYDDDPKTVGDEPGQDWP